MKKIELLPNSSEDPGCATFVLNAEDHTMGAPLQYLIMKNPAVEFCAYSQPHPTDDLIHLRIQTDGSVTAADALAEGIHNLMDIGLHILNKYEANLEHGEYEIQPSPSV